MKRNSETLLLFNPLKRYRRLPPIRHRRLTSNYIKRFGNNKQSNCKRWRSRSSKSNKSGRSSKSKKSKKSGRSNKTAKQATTTAARATKEAAASGAHNDARGVCVCASGCGFFRRPYNLLCSTETNGNARASRRSRATLRVLGC